MKIKVVSLNIWHGGRLFDEAIDFLKSEAADIVLLQEVYNGTGVALEDRLRSIEVLTERLEYSDIDFVKAFTHDAPEGMIPQGNAVLSKFPIVGRSHSFLTEATKESYKDVPSDWSIEPRVLQHVELNVLGNKVDVFNMHGVWDLAGDSYSEPRRQMTDIILREVGGKEYIILGGDSNATFNNKMHQRLAHKLNNVFDVLPTSTFNMKHKDNIGYATAAVDALYVSGNITVLEYACPDVDISDHLPVITTIQLSHN